MKTLVKVSLAGCVLAAITLAVSLPSRAQFSISLGGPDGSISFSTDTGGYCDSFGCPDDYWDLPVYYGPVYYGGIWYRGPVYYREIRGHHFYWLRSGWRRNEWHGPLPSWAARPHYGPALGINFYYEHFRRPPPGKPGWNRPGWNRPGSGLRPPVTRPPSTVRPPVQPPRPTKPSRPGGPTTLPARPPGPGGGPQIQPPRPGGPTTLPARLPQSVRPPAGNQQGGGPKPAPGPTPN